MMQCGNEPAGTFKAMADDSSAFKLPLNSEIIPAANSGDRSITRRLSFSSENDVSTDEGPNGTCTVLPLERGSLDSDSHTNPAEVAGQLAPQAASARLTTKKATGWNGAATGRRSSKNENGAVAGEDKENTARPSESTHENAQREDSSVTPSKQHSVTEDSDAEVARRAQQEGRVNVLFPGAVTQEGCCRFVSEILKCILYQRQQLPMTYDQLVYSQRKQQASVQDKDVVNRRPMQPADMDRRKCQKTLQDVEEVLQQLEVLFSLSKVPRVLLLMGGSLNLPKELYEINMEALVLASGDRCLRVSSCLRQLFRTLFVADLLSDSRPVCLMSTTVLVLAHRDCGVGWFRPKLQFKVPTRGRSQIIAMSTERSTCEEARAEESDWQDYVWFQAPMAIKGFSN